jgi:hypothetical protein
MSVFSLLNLIQLFNLIKTSIFSQKMSVFNKNFIVFSLKLMKLSSNINLKHLLLALNSYFLTSNMCFKWSYFCNFFRYVSQNRAIFDEFKFTEIIASKLNFYFREKIVPTQILIKNSMKISECMAPVSLNTKAYSN